MKFYDGPNHRFDFVQLPQLMRAGQIYSVAIAAKDDGFVVQVDVAIRGQGLKRVDVFRSAHSKFNTKEEANQALVNALSPKIPQITDTHYRLAGKSAALCGAEDTKATRFNYREPGEQVTGPICHRCQVIGFSLGQ